MKTFKLISLLVALLCATATWAQSETPWAGDGTSDNPYKITSKTDWNALVTAVNEDGKTFAGKYFLLTEDLKYETEEVIATMIGSDESSHYFSGTFDGGGHYIYVSYVVQESYIAPFRFVKDATIKNLRVEGTYIASAPYAAGIVSVANGTTTIENCRVSIYLVNDYAGGDTTHGGLVAINRIGSLKITGCIFDGGYQTLGGSKNYAGFVGWNETDNNSTVVIKDCLFAPDIVTIRGTEGVKTFCRSRVEDGVTLSNCYYLTVLGEPQGKEAYNVTARTGVTMTMDGTPTTYSVSGLKFYGENKGFEYDGKIRGGNGDQVALNLEGFQYFQTSSGTLTGDGNPRTLTMVAADAEIAGMQRITVVETEEQLFAAIDDGANIQLGNSINLNQEVKIDGNKIVVIDLNGKTLNRNLTSSADDGHVFKISSDSRLTINDSSDDNSGVIKGGYSSDGGAIYNSGTLIFNGGTIKENNASNNGAGIYNRSNLVINGGAITDNTAANNGGGIFNEGTLHMQGTINVTNNTRSSDNRAANLYLNSGKIRLTAALTNSHIGVDMPNPGVITTDFSLMNGSTEPNTIFTSDYAFVEVQPYQGEASLKYYYLDHHWDSENNTLVEEKKFFEPGSIVDFSNSSLTLHDGNYVVRQSETIDYLQIAGDVKLLLCDGVTLTVNRNIFIMSIGNDAHFLNFYTQTANSTGKVITKGEVAQYADYAGPGIGDPNNTGSTISIHGGVFDVKGCDYGAGIGLSGKDDNVKKCETTINIYGGTITAQGGKGAAGIGGGMTNPYYGNINIYGGNITATGGASPGGAGIGGGDKSKEGVVHIYGGTVNANGGHEAAGIGCGQDAISFGSGKIHISGGKVTARGDSYAAGIGGGDGVPGFWVNISGGEVYAYGGTDAAGIGGGEGAGGGSVMISGGYVEAYGKSYGAGIGGGEDGKGASVTIEGGTVIAKAGDDALSAIGPGKGSSDYGSLTIGDAQMVRTTTSSTPFTASERKNGCWKQTQARVEPCTHASVTYTASGATTDDTHTKHCKYCTTHFPAEQHTFNSNDVCTVCGIDLQSSTVNIYLPKEEGTDALDGKTYTRAATYMMVFGTEFTLPHCPVLVSGLEFVGWEVRTVASGTYVSGDEYVSPYITTGGTIKKPGDNFTIVGNVSFVARYKKLNIDLADTGDNGEALSQFDGRTVSNITLIDRNLYADNSWNTLCLPFDVDNINSTCLVGATVKTLETTSFANGTLTMNFTEDANNITKIVAGTPYIVKWKPDYVISSKVQWDSFALSVKEGTSYEGKLIHVTADIGDSNNKLTATVGTSDHPFKGTIDGKGHTLYFGIEPNGEDILAPFRYVDGASFRNLIVTGSVVNTEHIQTGGLIGSSRGEINISNCVSDVSVQDNGTSVELAKNGGFISTVYDGSVYFTNCAFTGSLMTNQNARCWSGFVGWREETSIPLTFRNCLYNPRETSNTNRYNSTFSGNGNDNNTYDNCYYRRSASGVEDNNQGTYSNAAMSEQVTLLGNKWEVRKPFLTYTTDKAVPKMLSGIIDPVFHNVTIRNITGDVATDYVDFIGLYSPKTIAGEDRTILFVGDENQLYYPNAAMIIGSCRAYFQLKGIEVGEGDESTTVRSFNMNFGEEQTSSLPQPLQREGSQAGAWYDLSGRKLDGKPTRKGLYIVNGHKVVIK